jgi:hypothetical protein
MLDACDDAELLWLAAARARWFTDLAGGDAMGGIHRRGSGLGTAMPYSLLC